MPPCSNCLADHEAGDVLKKDEGNIALSAKFDEVSRLERAFGKQNTVVADDADRIAPDPRESADDGLAVERFEFVKPAGVDDAVNDFADVVRLLADRAGTMS